MCIVKGEPSPYYYQAVDRNEYNKDCTDFDHAQDLQVTTET